MKSMLAGPSNNFPPYNSVNKININQIAYAKDRKYISFFSFSYFANISNTHLRLLKQADG